jgi:hypothetical protein
MFSLTLDAMAKLRPSYHTGLLSWQSADYALLALG